MTTSKTAAASTGVIKLMRSKKKIEKFEEIDSCIQFTVRLQNKQETKLGNTKRKRKWKKSFMLLHRLDITPFQA